MYHVYLVSGIAQQAFLFFSVAFTTIRKNSLVFFGFVGGCIRFVIFHLQMHRTENDFNEQCVRQHIDRVLF